jgi:DNA-binding CsgD family transcriptional regulator
MSTDTAQRITKYKSKQTISQSFCDCGRAATMTYEDEFGAWPCCPECYRYYQGEREFPPDKIDPVLQEHIIDFFESLTYIAEDYQIEKVKLLTPTEVKICRISFLPNHVIGKITNSSPATIRTHISNARRKCEVTTKQELMFLIFLAELNEGITPWQAARICQQAIATLILADRSTIQADVKDSRITLSFASNSTIDRACLDLILQSQEEIRKSLTPLGPF